MLPNTPLQQPAPHAASLPAVPAGTQPPQAAISPLQQVSGQAPGQVPGGPVPMGSVSTEEVAERARRLVEQYEQAPYQLAEAFNQLKGDYLSRQHHITSNPAGS